MPKSFTARVVFALIAAIAAAVIVSPFVALAVASFGFRFPFPRIFDRVVMVCLGVAVVLDARGLTLLPLLKAGYARPIGNLGGVVRGLTIALGAMLLLFVVAAAMVGIANAGRAATMFPRYLLSGIVIAIIEEGFFRAFLLAGMERDFGRTGALLTSSAIYAVAHLVRAPAHFYVANLDITAGLRTLMLSFSRLGAPVSALPTLVGLFLLGVVLAKAFLLTGTVWFSVGLHAGLVVGAKLWPKIIVAHHALPGWLGGWGYQPIISGLAAWIATIVLLLLLRPLAGSRAERTA